MNRLMFAAVALGLFAFGCKPATDLNKPCNLVKTNPDGGSRPVPIRESEIRDLMGANKDFISIGSIDCDDLSCVRDSAYKSDAGLGDPALGYCSRQCTLGTACDSFDSDLDRGPKALSCRALLLSAETLGPLGDAGFPGIRDPYFCARGGSSSDAGAQ